MDKDIQEIRDNFPILERDINKKSMIYLDNAATTQIPKSVIREINSFDKTYRANVHRSGHTLGLLATKQYEVVRKKIKKFINARSSKEIIFTSGCTDSLNLIASTYGEKNIHTNDEIVVSIMEHHSNLLPWQQLALKKGAKLKFIELNSEQELDLDDAEKKISSKTKIVAVTHVSNVLGCINPIKKIIDLAHKKGAITVIDGAQAVGHFNVDVQDLDVDFYAFSSHKMFGPDGVGVLYGKKRLLEEMPPYRVGGEMIDNVTREKVTWASIPHKFEAGTPNIEGVIGLGSAIDFLEDSGGLYKIWKYEQKLVKYLFPKMEMIKDLTIYGSKNLNYHTGVISFNLNKVHAHDVATAFDYEGIEVRAGYHCAQPLVQTLGVDATVRASFSLYNTKEEADKFLNTLCDIKEFFK